MSALISILSLIASVWVFFGYIDPQYQVVKGMNQEKTAYEAALASANQLEQVKTNLVSKYNSMDPSELARLNTLLPDSVDTVRLIIEINSIAGRYGMAIKDTKVDSGKTKDTTANQVLSSAPSEDKSKYLPVNLAFSIAGPYDNFRSFLNDLEKNLKVVDVTSISLKPLKGTFYQYDIKARAYSLK